MRKAQQKILLSVFRRVIGFYLMIFRIAKKDDGNLKLSEHLCDRLSSNNLLKFLFKFINNPFQHSLLEFVFYEVTRKIKFKPKVIDSKVPSELKIKSHNYPSIVLTTHTGFAFVTRYVLTSKKNLYVVANDAYFKGLKNCFDRTGINGKVNVILNDKYCLANIKERLAQNATIICCVDHRPVGSKNYTLISPNIFKFVHLLNLPVFFHKDEILSNGHVKINFFQANPSLDANLLAQQFIDYINESRQFKKFFALNAKEK